MRSNRCSRLCVCGLITDTRPEATMTRRTWCAGCANGLAQPLPHDFSTDSIRTERNVMPNPLVPTCAELASDEVLDQFDDMVNPPGLTNHWATAQVDHDVLAVRSLNVPPVSQGDSISAQLYLDGRLARSFGQPVHTRRRPARAGRRTATGGRPVRIATR